MWLGNANSSTLSLASLLRLGRPSSSSFAVAALFATDPFSLLGLDSLALRRFRSRLMTLAISEPIFGFLDLAIDLALFEHAPGDCHLIGGGHNLVGRLGQEFCVEIVAAGRPVPCWWSALGWQGARNRRQAIAFETLHFRGGHSQMAAGRGFGCNDAVSHKTRTAASVVPSW